MGATKPDEKGIFNAARRIGSPEERRQFVAGACSDDPDLYDRVTALLRVHDEDSGFLLAPAIEFRETIAEGAVAELGGALGPYTLLAELGEGGMGVVYLAEQSQPVKRQVALKIIRPGMDTRQAAARFDGERKALAQMSHPNIATVLDVGVIPAGRAYFVMELVRGAPITRYCDVRRLPIRDRLALFVQVCRGVQHAHQKGIIHRDLKPSNVLVPEFDGKPVPKIIDFGVAKAIRCEPNDGGHVTQFGLVVGTPEYMSPEQADAGHLDIDTRSDVYALGVLLYELLTGTTPLRRDGAKDGVAAMLLRIREEEPLRPSALLSQCPELRTVAAERNTDPARLVGQVRGDLDWIALKCLEKDRTRRYETADGLARDVERHLGYETVEASPPRVGYRLRKFARRHRAALSTAAAFALLLVVGTAVSAWQAVRASQAKNEALADRDRKENARRQTRLALNALTDEWVERLMGRQAQLTEEDRDYLRRVLAMHEEFAADDGDSPESRIAVAEARYRVALIRQRLGDYREAEATYRVAIALQRALAEEFTNRPDLRRDLGRSHTRLGGLLREMGQPAPAEEACTAAVGILQQLDADFPGTPEYRRELAVAYNSLGLILLATNRSADAEVVLRKAVSILEPYADSEDRRHLAVCYQNLGHVLYKSNRFEPAEACYLRARDLALKLADDFPKHPDYRRDVAQFLANLGPVYVSLKRPNEAEESFRAAAIILQKLTDEYPARPDYRKLLAGCRSNQGNLLTRQRRLPQAEEAYLAARSGYERLAGDYPLVPEYQSELGKVLAGLALLKAMDRDPTSARRLMEQAFHHDRAALRIEPSNPIYRESYRTHLALFAEIAGVLRDHAAAVAAADELARFAFEPAVDAFTAAWIVVRCIDLVAGDKQLSAVQQSALTRAYADRSMNHLRTAVRLGFKDAARLNKDTDFDPLRKRDDFRDLLRALDDNEHR